VEICPSDQHNTGAAANKADWPSIEKKKKKKARMKLTFKSVDPGPAKQLLS